MSARNKGQCITLEFVFSYHTQVFDAQPEIWKTSDK